MSATVDIVIPVYNEEQALPRSIVILADFLRENLSNPWKIIIVDNASTDGTRSVSEMLCQRYPGVNYLYLPQKGRGRALRAAWLDSTADIVSYMDVDLSTDITYFPALLESLESGYQVAIGSRLSKGSEVTRGLRREFTSRTYNFLIKAMFLTGFPDAQCGFKAMTRSAAEAIVPKIDIGDAEQGDHVQEDATRKGDERLLIVFGVTLDKSSKAKARNVADYVLFERPENHRLYASCERSDVLVYRYRPAEKRVLL